jgi:hypothetical protein
MSVSVPVSISVTPVLLLGWITRLEALIAGEKDAGRMFTAKELEKFRTDIVDLLPPGLGLNENRE